MRMDCPEGGEAAVRRGGDVVRASSVTVGPPGAAVMPPLPLANDEGEAESAGDSAM